MNKKNKIAHLIIMCCCFGYTNNVLWHNIYKCINLIGNDECENNLK